MTTLEYKYPKWIADLKDTPAKLILVHSGRGGGGKTTALALYAVAYAIENPHTRIVMGREIMRTIKESNIEMVKTWLTHPHMRLTPDAYKITARTITFANGSDILFMGLSSSHGTSAGFQSTTDIDMLIVDEAQALTHETCHRVFPTIRKPNSKIILSYNPHSPANAVEHYRRMAQDPQKNRVEYPEGDVIDPYILDIPLTWRDNPWFKQSDLYQQLLWDKAHAPDAYQHKWEGAYVAAEGYRIAHYTDIMRCYHDFDDLTLQRAQDGAVLAYGLDLAISDTGDNTALARVQGGLLLGITQFPKGRTFTQIAHHLTACKPQPQWVNYDATGIGAGFRDVLNIASPHLSNHAFPLIFGGAPKGKKTLWDGQVKNEAFFRSRRDQMYFALKQRIENTLALLDNTRNVHPKDCLLMTPKYIAESDAQDLAGQIAQPVYTFTARGHVQFDKAPDGADSPDMLDALALAYATDSQYGLRSAQARPVHHIPDVVNVG